MLSNLDKFFVRDHHPSAPNYTLVLLLAAIFVWVGILCFLLSAVAIVWGLVVVVNKNLTTPLLTCFMIAIQFFIAGVVNLCISQVIHAFRDIARNGFKQNTLLAKLTGEQPQNQHASTSAMPDLAPVPKPEKDRNPLSPPAHWVPGTPRGWTISGLDINGNQFHLSYLWTSESEAVGLAKAEGLITIQEIQPIKG